MEDMLQVVDSHRLLRVKDNQIVAIAFVVAEEEIFAMLRSILSPILACYINRRSLGVLIPTIFYVVTCEPLKYFITSFHSAKVVKML